MAARRSSRSRPLEVGLSVTILALLSANLAGATSHASDPGRFASGIPDLPAPPAGAVPVSDRLLGEAQNGTDALFAPRTSAGGSVHPDSAIPSGPVSTLVGTGPFSAVADRVNGLVYIVNAQSDNVTVMNGTRVVASVDVGITPISATYDSRNGFVYVMNSGYPDNNVSIINGTRVIASLGVGDGPQSATFDSGNGLVYVCSANSDAVSVLNGTSILTSVNIGSGSFFSAYDPDNGFVYVAGAFGTSVSVINGTSLIGTVTVGADPSSIVYDPDDGYVYVVSALGNVSVVNGTSVIATVHLNPNPYGAAYDSSNGYVYVSISDLGGSVDAIDGTTLVASIRVGSLPGAGAFDSRTGELYVPNQYSRNVSIIRGTSVVGSAKVGAAPIGAIYDPESGYVYVENAYSNNESVFNAPSHRISFQETGLPTGKSWSVSLRRQVESSTGTSLSMSDLNGTYGFLVRGPAGYAVDGAPPFGNVTVLGANVTESFSFSRGATSTLSFHASGLAPGAYWCVTVGFTSCSTKRTIPLKDLSPAAYPYAVLPLRGYTTTVKGEGIARGPVGVVQLVGRSLTFQVAFHPILYAVTFLESGLPVGVEWHVRATCIPTNPIGSTVAAGFNQLNCASNLGHAGSRTSTITLELRNGTYNWSIRPVPGYEIFFRGAAGGTGTLSVVGAPITLQVEFVRV